MTTTTPTAPTGDLPSSPPVDARYPFTRIDPIDATDAELEAFVAHAELPALLIALALATHDADLIPSHLTPPHTKGENWVPLPHGGWDEAQQAEARRLALRGLRTLRDTPGPSGPPSAEELDRAMRFVIAKDIDAYRGYLLREVENEDPGAPRWHKSTVAPDRAFTALVIGVGVSGIALLHRFAQAGVDVIAVEKESEVGGTWWNNRYPGCRLDTNNYAYSYSFARKGDWPQQFSRQPEILNYLREVTDRFDLRRHIRFETEVVRMAYDAAADLWEVLLRSSDGSEQTVRVDVVIPTIGQLNTPKIPDVEGRETFTGPQVHTARWDDDIEFAGRRIAVIGSGASAFQVGPALAPIVRHMTLFQRTAPWGMPTPAYYADVPEGMLWLLRHVPGYADWFRLWQLWQATEGRLPSVTRDPAWQTPGSVSAINQDLRQALIRHITAQYSRRPDLIEKVIPPYPPGAKRMLRDNGVWAQTLQRENVELVGSDIVRIEPTGIRTADGTLHEVDAIVYATGFRAEEHLYGLDVTGRDGTEIHDYWNGDTKAYNTIMVPRFPNLFLTSGPNTAIAANGSGTYLAECAADFTLECVRVLLESGARSLEPTQEALDRFIAEIDAANDLRAWSGVRGWYLNKKGRASQTWPHDMRAYFEMTRGPIAEDFRFNGTAAGDR
ncbi:4-hydroxyacetophenone monooxygenase [Microbacterium sp. SORGH_AS 1204]|uniref:flavin-containing monooxygenase n=1 Tax=Microbacterium sp. SORGH_AS_1204 TaxID=3041785 RepID=UPI002794E4AE|nr:NAD(P)/FAD-dependent oxidoreductase [Microbacterium sp. SORGH_AS_1204]MDQ1136364.1 4-hydroxyacetophenone monooxygenase [Microbacterium sp. SORGH_AS_1204]